MATRNKTLLAIVSSLERPFGGIFSARLRGTNRSLRSLLVGLLVAYTAALLLGTLFPFNFGFGDRALSKDHPMVEWFPFTYWPKCGFRGYFGDKLINTCMFIPFGVLLSLIIGSCPKPRSLLLKTTLATALLSLTIETMQYFIPERQSSASDLLLNTVGGVLGAWLVIRGIQLFSLNLGRTP
jgi:glycopeptide antibiotics resistance protein